ncbi:MAG: hypothetical protein L0Y66_05965 [Myxococcaceae bacterium]|nr:hypothetical protein [Myxococcaceae bacterium]MCI0669691.1 hypothetical protein [Myxococcaceae bacterium]
MPSLRPALLAVLLVGPGALAQAGSGSPAPEPGEGAPDSAPPAQTSLVQEGAPAAPPGEAPAAPEAARVAPGTTPATVGEAPTSDAASAEAASQAISEASPQDPPPVTAPVAQPRPFPPPPRPEDFNQVSLFGGQALGAGHRAVGAFLGFPLLGFRGAVGITSWLDLGLGFESFYGVMNDVRAFARFNLVGGGRWDVSVVLEGSRAFFAQKPMVEDRGARWLTGRRNWNAAPGVMVSLRGASPHAARLFADVRYHLAVDTEPFQEDPLGGLPPEVVTFHNVPVRFGAELPFSPTTAFLAQFGFDIHGSPRDAPFMPVIGVGVVTSL